MPNNKPNNTIKYTIKPVFFINNDKYFIDLNFTNTNVNI